MSLPGRPSWKDSDRLVPRAFVQPVLRFMQVEAASGAVMLLAAIAALVWANSMWHGSYERLWDTDLLVRLGGALTIDQTLRDWVNNAAMALFFLIAGLEIKRQLLLGELRNPRAAALPALAALGGMLVPALIYTLINAGHPGSGGWGIPVATDIAFAVGIVTLAGKRVPIGAKIFILTLAVVDDVGGIVVIAVFYAEKVSFGWLAVAGVAVVLTIVANRNDVRSVAPYIVLGTVCWLALFEAGVESAIVGVIFGLLTPVRPFRDPEEFPEVARRLVDDVERSYDDGLLTDDEREHNENALEEINRLSLETSSPLERVENRLGLWVSLLIVPVFAFANAGVRIETGGIDGRVFLGVALGLVLGKTIGVFSFSWLAVRLGVGSLPSGVRWAHLFGLAVTAGIGFTVALFVTSLSFDDPGLTSSAKLGVLAASTVAGVLGLLLLRAVRSAPTDGETEPDERDDASVLAPSAT